MQEYILWETYLHDVDAAVSLIGAYKHSKQRSYSQFPPH